MSVATLIQKPTVSRVILAEITVGMLLAGFYQTGGDTKAWRIETARTITAVTFNGSALTAGASYADVNGNDGKWFSDGSILYVSPPTSETAFRGTYIATVSLQYSSKEKIFANVYWEPRLVGVPNISMRIESRFGGIGQIGGGNLTLINSDGQFDGMTDLKWHSAAVTIKLGVDVPDAAMAYADYVTVGKWLVEDASRSDADFVLKLKEVKTRLSKKLPISTYTLESYPALKDNDVGKPIQIAYGFVQGGKAVCIDVGTKTFKVAGHAIKDFLSVRVKTNDVWQMSTFASTNRASGEFTLGNDWTGDEDVSVDFYGKKNADGTLMENIADIIQDILATVGETDIDTASFTAAQAALEIGADNWGEIHTLYRSGLQLTESRDAVEVLSPLIEAAGAFLFCDNTGQYFLKVFSPEPSESLPQFNDVDILEFAGPFDESQYVATSLRLEYAKRSAEDKASFMVTSSDEARLSAGQPVHVLEEKSMPLAYESDAAIWSQAFLLMTGQPLTTYKLTMPWNCSLVKPGDQISVNYSRRNFSGTLEILDIKHDLMTGKVNLVCGDLRAWRDAPGWWVADAPTLPTRFSALAGYGAGSGSTWNSSWSDEIKAWARRNIGFWCNDNGCAATGDGHAFKPSTWTV